MGSDRKRLVMWRRLMLMHAAARQSLDSVADVATPRPEWEVSEPVAGSKPAWTS